MMNSDLLRIAQEYVTRRSRGDLSDARTIAHNAVLDALTAVGIAYDDREHAARIAEAMVARPEHFDETDKTDNISQQGRTEWNNDN